MPHRIVNPSALYDPRPNGYSHVVVSEPGGRLIHVAGQGGEDRDGRLAKGFQGQVAQAFANLRAALASADASPADVVKLTTYIVDHDETKLATLADELRRTFGEAFPAQTLVPVSRLALDGMLFEVDAVAIAR
ncbi:RidA family protein [Marinivivus vitaminiproducens]|uniref:RidA family protein n=1 Tax=Marinivivus vitaminiproducens TaxID=3035935 RepID=UPI0027A72960|nr:RidA family protein [Geminicoccaceae bacterium SCSIO 64248]